MHGTMSLKLLVPDCP